jgi:uncharacterized protein YegP (UPF0339 family)
VPGDRAGHVGDAAVKSSRFDVYQDKAGEWRWRLLAPNGRTIADSGEGYTREADARRATKTVAFHVARAQVKHGMQVRRAS